MQDFIDYLRSSIVGLGSIGGGFGLFLIAFCDSSFISLPEVNDLLIVYFSMRFREHAYFYALMATLGSVSGASVLYWLGRWRGHRFLVRRYSESRLRRAFDFFRRYGVLALVGPAVLPPPFPFKIFVLSAGVFGIPFGRFLTAILLGRAIRYAGEAWLALRFGERALGYISEHYPQILVVVVAVTLAAAAVYLGASFLRRRRRASSNNP